LKIAVDVAKGLAYLHSHEVNIILGDFETSKILIDSVGRFVDFKITSLAMESLLV
jgi:serine/threonine protein kinase